MDSAMDLESTLAAFCDRYSAYNRDPVAWETEHGAWVEFEHLEKSKVLYEVGRILELLHQKTAHEQSLDTAGDLEYYSTVRVALEKIRVFLENRKDNRC